MKKVKRSKTKEFFKGLAIATAITVCYGAFFSQTNTDLVKALSQKREFVAGIDFVAYNKKEHLNINIPTMKTEEKDKKTEEKDKKIENWEFFVQISNIISWHNLSYSNALGFTPYYGNLETTFVYKTLEEKEKEKKNKKEKSALERIAEGDKNLKEIVTQLKKPNFAVLKIKGDDKYYKNLDKKDPLTFIVKRTAQNVNDFPNKVVIELEAPDNGDYKAHKKRIDLVKKINPKFKIATSLDKKEGYDEKTGVWDPEKSRKYWENSDIIILEDYFSKPDDLKKSLKKFRQATQGKKQIWTRIVVGSKRINERGKDNLESTLKEYEQTIQIIKQHADGCIANDTNGLWLYSKNAPDKNERLKKIKQLYKVFRKIKIEKTYSYGGH